MGRHAKMHNHSLSPRRRHCKSGAVSDDSQRDQNLWRTNTNKECDVSPSKSSRTSVLSYSTESLSSSSYEAAGHMRSSSSQLNFEIGPSTLYGDSSVIYEHIPSDMNHFRFDESANARSTNHSMTNFGLSPASLTEDSVISWTDSTLQRPYESLIDSKPSQISTDDDTIQVMRHSTKQFQQVGKHSNPGGAHDGSFFPTMFAITENPFSKRYRPVTLSHIGQSVSRFHDTSPLRDENRKHHKKPIPVGKTSEYTLTSLSPVKEQEGNPSHRISIMSLFWTKTIGCFAPNQSFNDEEDDECNRGCMNPFRTK